MQLFEVGHGIEHVDYHRSRIDTGPYTIWIGFAPQQCQDLAGPSKTDNVLRRRHFRHRHIWRFGIISASIPKSMRDNQSKIFGVGESEIYQTYVYGVPLRKTVKLGGKYIRECAVE